MSIGMLRLSITKSAVFCGGKEGSGCSSSARRCDSVGRHTWWKFFVKCALLSLLEDWPSRARAVLSRALMIDAAASASTFRVDIS